jgi:hypothetical protein
MAAARQNEWRHKQIAVPQQIVEDLAVWHGGQSAPTYALMSWGMRHPVSLSMIDSAISELEGVKSRARASDVRGLGTVIGRLKKFRKNWRKARVKSDGYDARDYGWSFEDELEFGGEALRENPTKWTTVQLKVLRELVFHKGQRRAFDLMMDLRMSHAWTTLHQLEKRGAVTIQGKGAAGVVTLTEVGVKALGVGEAKRATAARPNPSTAAAAVPPVPKSVERENADWLLVDGQRASLLWVPRPHPKSRYTGDFVAVGPEDGGSLSLVIARVRMEKRDGAWGAEEIDAVHLPLNGKPVSFERARRLMNPERARVMARRLLAHVSGDAAALRRVGMSGYMLLAQALGAGPRANPRARKAAKRR